MRHNSNFFPLRPPRLLILASLMLAAAFARAGDPAPQTAPSSIFDDNPNPATPGKPAIPPASRPPVGEPPTTAPSGIVADSVLIAADDFVTDIYLNGQRVPDEMCKLKAELYGATVMRVTVDIHPGDSLVFNVVNDRFRWNGSAGLSVAGMLGDARTPAFVSETDSGNWSGCDSLDQASQFIKDPTYLRDKAVVFPDKPWKGCNDEMKKRCDWTGQTIWASGSSRNVWIRYIAPR